MNGNNRNGNNRIIWWLLGFFAVIVISIAGAWIKSIETKVDTVANIQGTRGERISALETVLPHIKERLDSIDRRLEKITENRSRK